MKETEENRNKQKGLVFIDSKINIQIQKLSKIF